MPSVSLASTPAMSGLDLSKYQKTGATPAAAGPATGAKESGISKLLNTEISFFEKKFDAKQKEWFYSELGLLISAGVDIRTAFGIIELETENKKHRALIARISNDIVGGSSVAEALGAHPKIFSNYECQSIRIGEETGHFAEVLHELGAYYESAVKLKRQIVGTLTYPVIVITLAILIVYFMLSFVVPMFGDIFKQTGGQLPATTQFLIRLSKKSSLIFYTLLTVVTGFYILHRSQRNKDWYRAFTSSLVLRIPAVNKLVQKIFLARFCQSMRLLMGAKVLLVDALDLVKNMIGYYPIEVALGRVKEQVLAGKLLHESLAENKIFPNKLVALIKVSEEVNAPELIFEKLSRQYSDEIEHQQAVVGKLIEPFFIVVLGLVIGFVLVAMYMPLFQLSNGF